METITVAALYQFTRFDDLSVLHDQLLELCEQKGLKGTILLSREGINGTVAGADDAIDVLIDHVRSLPGCDTLEVKYSRAAEMPFFRMKVRLKREIVTMGVDDIDAVAGCGEYVPPQQWNALISDPDTVTIDTRNAYEVGVGSFRGAIDPKTASFRDFPAWFDAEAGRLREVSKKPKIAMFCTGGIRCEKATAYVRSKGFDDVYHLQGGILKYLENIAEEDSLFEGECFVFDQRVAVGHGLKQGEHGQCHACRKPLSPQDMQAEEYVEGVCCPHCHDVRNADQRARYEERHRQMRLANRTGEAHLGRRHDSA